MIRTLFARILQIYLRRRPTLENRLWARDRLRKVCTNREMVVTTKLGFKMAVSPNDYASYGIYFFGEYDPPMTAFMQKFLEPGGVCWDIGTERGWFTLVMAATVGASGRVDAFEAYPPNYEKLMNNIALNGYSQVTARNLAVSDREGTLFFVPPSDEITHHVDFLENCSGVGFVTAYEQDDTIPVEAVSLDAHVKKHPLTRLDLIKIDIEGEELRALHGAEQTIRLFHPLMAIEYNRETSIRAGSSIEELDDFLDGLGYDRFSLVCDSGTSFHLVPLNDLNDIPDVHNVYCFHKDDVRART